ncbi:glycoside hydrolase family 1 protein [Candidatus Saccharibacteria bacterium]|nr:glycoside hydrolase family 1 protein [Candidatus Saccharibacteria bacterium]
MTSPKQSLQFPKRFLWGAAVAAHQVEGNTHNQWTVWELEHAKTLAAQAEYQYGDLPNWDDIKKDATNPDNYISGAAANHYQLYEHDFEIIKKMNMNSFRFSIEWSRIEPEEGVWSAEGIEHYVQYIDALKKRGIEPVITLFHFTLPVWFSEMGGFEQRKNVQYFVRFAEKIVSELGPSVRYIITINEPEVYATESYYLASWPPAVSSKRKWRTVMNNLALAHNRTAKAIHTMNRRYKVSVAKNSNYFYAGDNALLSRKSAELFQYFQDDYFLKKVVKQCDFLGVNYYFSNRVYGYRVHNPDVKTSDMGWDLSPANLEQALERLHDKYDLPIIITENGLADSTDEHRQWWLMQTIIAMQRAMRSGVKLEGYLHWSLLDNFEWDKGKWPRFGLIAVDYKTYKRSPRPSAIWYAKLLKKIRSEA